VEVTLKCLLGTAWVTIGAALIIDLLERCRPLRKYISQFWDGICRRVPSLTRIRKAIAYLRGTETGHVLSHTLVEGMLGARFESTALPDDTASWEYDYGPALRESPC
jgi:hypothetical protein